jgi:ferritin-like metal-binding protein YciE
MPEDTFRWVITGAVAISTLCIFAMAVTAIVLYRLMSRLETKTEGMIERVEPIVDTVKQLAIESAPNLSLMVTRAREIADNAKDVSDVARDQAYRFAEVGRDIADRTKVHVARIDAVVDDTVDQVQHAGTNVKAAMMKPVREASGVIAGVKAAVATYGQSRRGGMNRITQDEEMFI